MKKISFFFFISLLLYSVNVLGQTSQNKGEQIAYADPTIFVDNDRYYLTGTCGDGFTVLESTDMKHWTAPVPDNWILKKGKDTYGNYAFWAPQIVKNSSKYYLTYSAEGKMCIAESDKVTGPFKQKDNRPISDCAEMNIDTYLFHDDDGKWYMYHARYMKQVDMGGNTIQVAEFEMNTQRLKEETLQLCVKVNEPWELTENGRIFGNRTLEGPTVIKRDGVYYLFYSANDYQSIDYAVGYATATSPYGPWIKHKSNPIIHRNIVGENGSGHGDFFIGLDGNPYYVFHVHHDNNAIHPRTVRIVPLKMVKDSSTGIYDITVDTTKMIIPMVDYR